MNKDWILAVTFITVHLSLILFGYPEMVFDVDRSGYWAPILAGFLLEFILLRIYLSGLSAFPGEDLIRIFKRYGIGTARFLLLPLTAYFLLSIVILIRSHAELLTIVLLPKTPIWAFMLMLVVIPLVTSAQRLTDILRATVTLTLLSFPFILFSLLSCFQNIEINYAFPLETDLFGWNLKAFLSSLFAFHGFLFIGLMASHWNLSMTRHRRKLYFALLALLPIFILSVYIPLMIFGPDAASKLHYPLTVSIDTVDYEWLMFRRITIFYIAASLAFIIIYLSILIWMTATIVSVLYISASRQTLTWFVTAAAFLTGLLFPDWETIDWFIWLDTPLRLYSIVFIPLMTWGIGIAARRRMQE
ncbi:GerAB/ArcD/ProY family transporter [Paenibacillus tarimensis]